MDGGLAGRTIRSETSGKVLTLENRSLFPGWTGADISRHDRLVCHKLYERANKPTRFSGPQVRYAPLTETPDGFWVSRRHECQEPLEAAKNRQTGDRAYAHSP